MNQKRIFTLCTLCLLWIFGNAETVKLKITYNGSGVSNSDITIKHGDASIGSGRTDGNGLVSISTSMLVSKSIDVYGHKVCGGADKNWDVKGWVDLDDDNFYHLKMEEVVKEMSGMGMPESMLVAAWGLSASGCNDGSESPAASSKTENNPNEDSGNTTSTSGNSNSGIDLDAVREEKLRMQRNGLEDEIDYIDNRMDRKKNEILELEEEGANHATLRRANIDLEIAQLKKEKKELDLERVEAKLNGSGLSKARDKEVEERQDEIKVETYRLNLEDKNLKAEEKEIKKNLKFEEMGKTDLKKHLLDMKTNRKSKKISLKMKARSMKPERKAELEKEIEILDATIEKYEKRLEEVKAEER